MLLVLVVERLFLDLAALVAGLHRAEHATAARDRFELLQHPLFDEIGELVEEAVLAEFERIAERGGVLGAMETGYQRSKIQEESLLYEHRKHDGSYEIVGVNTFRNPHGEPVPQKLELIRSSEAEKQSQLKRLREFRQKHSRESGPMLERLKQAVMKDENVFAVLMDAVRVCSLGQITQALFEVGGQYRRSM